MKSPRKKVYVGMSGGVDSSVSAALLKEQGYDVTGVFIKVWQPDWIQCTWKQDRLDAMRVAAELDIPFVTLDLEQEYKTEVVDYMIKEYSEGRTPNPDVMCNKYVKFGGFFTWAKEQGADFVATGHYAQVLTKDGAPKLIMSNDAEKDQTYFLWTLTHEQLSSTIFPIGHMNKKEVRALARKFNLPTATKKDSQGLCFIGKIDIKDFLSRYIETKEGDVLNEQGSIIGKHQGALLYTLGERHGFTVNISSPHDTPYYIIAKNIKNNTITVSHKDTHGALIGQRTEVKLSNVVWNQGEAPIGKQVLARARYRAPVQKITFTSETTGFFDLPQNSLSPGQSLVVYNNNICLGGGIIEN